jgi:hypothetical protein
VLKSVLGVCSVGRLVELEDTVESESVPALVVVSLLPMLSASAS